MRRRQLDEDLATVPRPRDREAAPGVPSFRVTAVEGPRAGIVFTLDGNAPARVLVGKSPRCDVCIDDPEMSRRHAAFDIEGSSLRLADLGSKNGTFANGIRVDAANLHGSETVRMGGTVFRVDAAPPGPPGLAPEVDGYGRLLGRSHVMRRLYPLIARVAASKLPVLIEGETGTGKELCAEVIHEMGPRADRPFVVLDCAAVPVAHIEATLFGVDGNVAAPRSGLFEQAHEGTLYLDEIGALDLATQKKLLRALERGEIQRVGGTTKIHVDVRVIASSRRDLERDIATGDFGDDLFHRLAVARIEMPALRARRDDVGLLAAHFWSTLGGEGKVPDGLVARLEDESFPGNLRELANVVARAVTLGALADPLPPIVDDSGETGDLVDEVLALELPLPQAKDRVMVEFERRYVERVLAKHGGNVARAAAASGIARRYFQMLRARHAKG